MFDTLQKRCKIETLTNYVLSNEALAKSVVSEYCTERIAAFENSNENITRSIATYYSSGILGKRKYQSIRISLAMKSRKGIEGRKTALSLFPGANIPKILPYNKLARELNKIDIGKVYEINEEYLSNLEIDAPINGAYRDIGEYLPRLAKSYFTTSRKNTLQWYGETEGTFMFALGGDACPFGKHESACSFLVSFLNVGRKVATHYENFLIFGANCDETSPVVKKYVRSLLHQIVGLEKKTFQIENCPTIRFKLEELPNDMKMLAMLSGELTISAKYFSPFANVSKDNDTDLSASFGVSPKDKWKPWEYKNRLSVVAKVEAFKKKVEKQSIAGNTKRSKVTDFIAQQKSRQEFLPLLSNYIDKAHVEPLHLKNNAWQYYFRNILKEAIRKSNLPANCNKYSDVPTESTFARVILSLQNEVKAKCLAKKVRKWFDETHASGPELKYRFTGKDSRRLCHNFMSLVKSLSNDNDSKADRQGILVLAFMGQRLRDSVSLFNRFDINKADLDQLQHAASEYYRVNAMFVVDAVNPTIWTLGHIVPVHAYQVFQKYNQGLGIVTMEGREAKHIFLKKLSENTTYQRRWHDIFKHEFIMLIWLSEQGITHSDRSSKNVAYIPHTVLDKDPLYCYCGLAKQNANVTKCSFCSDPIMRLIEESVSSGKIVPALKL